MLDTDDDLEYDEFEDDDEVEPEQFPEEEEEEIDDSIYDSEQLKKMQIRRKIEEIRERKRTGTPKSYDNPDDYYDF